MAEWRERGYVPDSDEEGDSDVEVRRDVLGNEHDQQENGENAPLRLLKLKDDFSMDAQESSPALPPHPLKTSLATPANLTPNNDEKPLEETPGKIFEPGPLPSTNFSTVDKLEAQLSEGLSACRQVLSRTTTPVSDIESPLSSLPDSPGFLIPHLEIEDPEPQPQNESRFAANANDAPMPPSPTMLQTIAQRSFRPRALMQLHPFTMEFAKYQKDWEARGMRPVRLASGQAAPNHRPREETQDADAFRSSQNEMSSLRSSSPPADAMLIHADEPESLLNAPSPSQDTQVDSGDELPDLADILKGGVRLPPLAVAGAKRRRTADRTKHSRRKRLKPLDLAMDIDRDSDPEPPQGDPFDLPLSPPRTANPSSSLPPMTEELSDVARTTTPRPLPTPVVSSDLHQTAGKSVVEVSSLSEDGSEPDIDVSSSSNVAFENEESQGVFNMRRKIKGVLPASWINLDARRQVQPANRKNLSASPEKGSSGPARGVAKHIVSSGRLIEDSARQPWLSDFGSEEEDSDSSNIGRVDMPTELRQLMEHAVDEEGTFIEDDDVIVENDIDAMLPRAPRRPRTSGKRQRNLRDSWNVDAQTKRSAAGGFLSRPDENLGHGNRSGTGRGRRKKKPRTQQLTVFDAPGFTFENQAQIPRFLKVAARGQVSGRSSSAQNPRQKFFQLSTREDTEEVNDRLRNWSSGAGRRSNSHAAGHVRQSNLDPASNRPPANFGSTAPLDLNSDAQIRKLKTSTDRTLVRLQTTASVRPEPNADQPSLDRASMRPNSRRLGLFFAHVNRSGHGKLLNPALTRSAQLETPRLSLRPPRKLFQSPPHRRVLETSTLAQPTSGACPSPRVVPSRKSKCQRKLHPKKVTHLKQPDSDAEEDSHITMDPYAERLRFWISALRADQVEEDLRSLISSGGTDYACSSYIRSGSFASILEHVKDRRARAGQGFGPNTTQPPTSRVASVSAQLRILIAQASKVPNALSQPAASDISSLGRELQQLLCDYSWICYPLTSTTLEQIRQGLKDIISVTLEFVESRKKDQKPIASSILNQLVVCAALYVDIVASVKPKDGLLMSDARALLHSAVEDTFATGLETQLSVWPGLSTFEGELRVHTQSINLATTFSRLDLESFGGSRLTYMIDFIVIARHLPVLAGGPQFDFSSTLSGALRQEFLFPPLPRLAFALGILRLIYPLTRLNEHGTLASEMDNYVGWSFLHPFMDEFLTYAHESRPSTNNRPATVHYGKTKNAPAVHTDKSRAEVSEVAEVTCILLSHCVAFMKVWHWNDDDPIIKDFVTFYAKTDLVGLVPVQEKIRNRALARRSERSVDNKTDFAYFLELVAATLARKRARINAQEGPDLATEVASIRSLAFNLLPSSTKFFGGRSQAYEDDWQSLRNHYDLFLTLYIHIEPPYRPQPRQIERLFEFATCPANIRSLVIDAWVDLTTQAINLPDGQNDANYLQSWGRRILACLAAEFKDANLMGHNELNQEVSKLRARLSKPVSDLVQGWRYAVEQCLPRSPPLTDLILAPELVGELRQVINHMGTHLSYDSKALLQDLSLSWDHCLQRVEAYVAILEFFAEILVRPQCSPSRFRSDANELAIDIVATILSCDTDFIPPSGRNYASFAPALSKLTSAWYQIASVQIDLNHSWDEYLTGPSRSSFPVLADTETSRQSKVKFAACIVQSNPMVFIMDRFTYYSIWIEGLVVPEHLMAFEHELSAEMYRYDLQQQMLGGVLDKHIEKAPVNNPSQSLKTDGLPLGKLKEHRLQIIDQLLFRMFMIWKWPSTSYESQNSAEDLLDPAHIINLLRIMTDSMKAQWRALTQPRRQAEYTEFVQQVIGQIQNHNFGNYSIDNWFTDDESEFPKRYTKLAEYFRRPVGAAQKGLSLEMIRAFDSSLFDAVNAGAVEAWVETTAEALSCNGLGGDLLTDDLELLVDPALQILFLSDVCPLYIEWGFDSAANAVIADAVVWMVTTVIRKAHLRLEETNDKDSLVDLVVVLLRHLAGVLRGRVTGTPLMSACAELALACYSRFRCLLLEVEPANKRLPSLAEKAAAAVFAAVKGETADLAFLEAESSDHQVEAWVVADLAGREGDVWRVATAWWREGEAVREWEGLLGVEQ